MAEPPPKRPPKLLLLLLDGCRPDALLAADAPNVRALLRNAKGGASYRCAFSLHCTTEPVPISAPSWATLLTGRHGSEHRVSSNDLDAFLSTDAGGKVFVKTAPCYCRPPQRASACFVSAFSQAKRRRIGEAVELPPTL
ncbi:unnamed protein product, partial [Symbiodinium microadriaticum]